MKGQFLTVLLIVLLLTGNAAASGAKAQDPILRIEKEIKSRVSRLPNYGVFDHLTFDLQGTRVILRGQASRPALKKSVQRVVARIEGVEEVLNQIEVLPVSGHDDQIRRVVYRNIYGHSWLSRYNPNRGTPFSRSAVRQSMGLTYDPPVGFHPIHIVVKNGSVTLEGMVQSQGDKTIAGHQARATAGVFSVINNLIVS